MITIAIANHKGGVGKTTSVASVGAEMARRGYNTLLCDLDAQQNLTTCFVPDEEAGQTDVNIYHAITGRTEQAPVLRIAPHLDLIPSGIDLAMAEQELSTMMARERRLTNVLAPLADRYDFCLLDCPPSLGNITTNALTAADGLIIPLTAEALPLKGLKMLDDYTEQVRKALNPRLKLSGVFITRFNYRTLNNAIVNNISATYGALLFVTKIRENIAVAEAPLSKKDIGCYDPESNGAKDYASLTDEILTRWSQPSKKQ